MLLRLAIGWHFFYEGAWKLQTSMGSGEPFSAEGYLSNATGPFAQEFRSLVDDPDGFKRLDFVNVKKKWEDEAARAKAHFGFDEAQSTKASVALVATTTKASDWFEDSENKRKIGEYKHKLQSYRRDEARGSGFSRKEDWMKSAYGEIQSTKRELVGAVDGWTSELVKAWNAIATPEQVESHGLFRASKGKIDQIDKLTVYALIAVGLGLLFGLLTRLSALGGACLLAMFYLSQPPFPGLPASPLSEGHYLYVNKNLIEFLACMAFVCMPSGRWFGLDALLFGGFGRRRAVETDRRTV